MISLLVVSFSTLCLATAAFFVVSIMDIMRGWEKKNARKTDEQ